MRTLQLPAGVQLLPSTIDPTSYRVFREDLPIGTVSHNLPGREIGWRWTHRAGGYGTTHTQGAAIAAVLELEDRRP